MRLILTILTSLFLAGSLMPALSAELPSVNPAAGTAAQPETAAHEEHGLSPDALALGPTGSYFITSSMVVTWTVALSLILFVRLATRKMQLAPTGAQNFLEWLVESLY